MSTAKKTTKKPAARPMPYAHAEDLADAYRDLRAAIVAVIELEKHGPVPFDDYVLNNLSGMSMHMTWEDADRKAAAWVRVGTASRRVHLAIHGKGIAVRMPGFVAKRAA